MLDWAYLYLLYFININVSYQSTIILIGILGATVSVLGTILIGFIVYYYFKTKNERERLLSRVPEDVYQQLEKIIIPKINKTISETDRRIQEVVDEILKSYKKQMVETPQELKNKIYRFSDTCSQAQDMILSETKTKVEQMGEILIKKVNSIYQTADKTIGQNIILAEKIIDDHKKEKIKEIDKKIYQIIGEVAKKTLGETIDLSTHERLVKEALEKAKKENLF